MPQKRTKAPPNNEALSRVLALLSDSALRQCAGLAVFQRGQAYTASDTVQDVEWAPSSEGAGIDARATVVGTHSYSTELWISLDESMVEGDDLECDCDCPHSQDGNFCKHQVALGLTLRGVLGGDAPQHSAEAKKKLAAAAKRAQTQADNRDKLKAFVHAQSAAALADRVWQWAQTDRGLMADLKSWAVQAQAGDDPKALKTAITELLKASGFLDWREASAYAQRARKVLPWLEQTLLKDPVEARALCEHALLRIYKVAGETDDSNGEVGDVMCAVQGLLVHSLKLAPPPASWLATWFGLMAADPWGNWNPRAIVDTAGPALQEAYSRKVAADWHGYKLDASAKATGTSYVGTRHWDFERSKLRFRYLEDLQHQGDPAAVIEVMRSSAQGPDEHRQLVAFCESHKRYREALQFSQTAHKLFPNDWGAEQDLLRCYERDGWDDEALTIRRSQLERSPTTEHFQAVLKAAKAAGKDVSAYREALYQWAEAKELEPEPVLRYMSPAEIQQSQLRHVSTRVEWLMVEGRVEQAFALVQPPHVCGSALLLQIALQLPKEKNADAIALLQRVFAVLMPRANTPYKEVLNVVREICKRMDSQPRKHWLLHLQAHYKAKRNFIKGLEGL